MIGMVMIISAVNKQEKADLNTSQNPDEEEETNERES
jgi:hypothetical protein